MISVEFLFISFPFKIILNLGNKTKKIFYILENAGCSIATAIQ